MKPRGVWLVGGLLALAAAISPGCGSTEDTPEPGLDAGIESGTPPGHDGGFEGGTNNCEEYCSADLHSFIDCKGNVVRTCAADEGCSSDGRCIPACDAIQSAKGSIGCDFYIHHPEVSPYSGDCFAAYVVNTWNAPVTLSGEAGGVAVDLTSHTYIPNGTGTSITYKPLTNGEIPPGGVAIVFLHEASSGSPLRCPKVPASASVGTSWNDLATETGKSGHVLRLTSSAPISAYDIYPYGGGISAITSATLLLPVTTWGTNYVAITPYSPGTNATDPALTVVASEDATSVTLLPTRAIVGRNGIASAPMNAAVTYTIDKGEMLHFSQQQDLVGSVISSDKPVGVWGEQTCAQVDEMACDSMHQQIPPVQALGSEYVAVRYRARIEGRDEAPPWRLVGAVDGTKLTWEPSVPVGAPSTVDRGGAWTFHAPGPFVVKSQDADHPFYFNAYMSGGGDPGCDPTASVFCFDGQGDAEFVNVVPSAQYQSHYGFFTDPTYPETNLVFVRAKAKDGAFKDVSLDCAGNLTGWLPVGASGNYEYTRADLSRHNFQPQGDCDNGRHEVTSDGPFSLTVWGWGSKETGSDYNTPGYSQYVSYAYPAGASFQSVNTVVVKPVPR